MVDIRKTRGTFANVDGQTVFMNKAENFVGSIFLSTKEAVQQTINSFHKEVVKNISKPPHSPHTLKLLDHPFAARHGDIQAHGHKPLWAVHKVSGDMLSSLQQRIITKKPRLVIGLLGWDELSPEEVKHAIFGTDKMLKRPVLRLTADSMQLRELFFENLLRFARRGSMRKPKSGSSASLGKLFGMASRA